MSYGIPGSEKNKPSARQGTFSISNALRLVETIKGLIGKETCIIDTQGIIIASTSPERIGQFHAAALELIASGEEQLIINEANKTVYPACRPGVNLPIVVDGILQGVVGISGSQEETELFGKIVQAFIQEQIQEINATQKQMRSLEIRNTFLTRWFLEEQFIPDDELLDQAKQFHIDMGAWKTVCVLANPKLQQNLPVKDSKLRSSNLSMIDMDAYRSVNSAAVSFHEQNLVLDLGYSFILLLTEADPKKVTGICKTILDFISNQYRIDLYAGVGTAVSTPWQLRQSFQEAQIAYGTTAYDLQERIRLFSGLQMDLIVDLIPKRYKQAVFHNVFGGFSEKELQDTMRFLESYIQHNGSISSIAADLYIHKNTVQYRLHKLLESTGLDARCIADMAWLFLLYKIYRTEHQN